MSRRALLALAGLADPGLLTRFVWPAVAVGIHGKQGPQLLKVAEQLVCLRAVQ